ncbi:hypothetical protein B296_00032900 [Ensete ventricosum]|uniref:Uncharacterized protein n=1 Tax=Ensete ventricosum TaxID=4639 RepID=A0A427ACK3_ENSVE|nr:hypothetical protein B296_00032900 [Ensete ventricosum]
MKTLASQSISRKNIPGRGCSTARLIFSRNATHDMQRIPTARVVFWPRLACCWNVARLGVEKRGIYRKQSLSVFGLGDLTRRPRPRRKDSRRELRERVSDGEGSVYGSTSIAKDVVGFSGERAPS